MILSRKKNILLKFALTLFIIAPIIVNAQDILSYSGKRQVRNYMGKANYTYKVLEGDTILDGSFQMQRSSLEALLKEEDISFLFKGSFDDGFPNGYWQFKFGEFESDSESEVVDYQYRVSISGIQEEAYGLMKLGKPDGNWTYAVNQIKDSEVEKTLFKSGIAFDNGIPQRNFRIENENNTLVGRFLRNGLAHDVWALYTTDAIGESENWSFNDGVLQKIQIQENESIKLVPVFDSGIKQTKIINLDARYINALHLQKAVDDSANVFDGRIATLLAENAKYYQKIDTIFSELGKSAFLPEFKVKVPYFPLDSTETVQMDSIKIYFEKSKTISDSLLNNSQLNILKLSDKESGFLYSVVRTISENFLVPLQKMVAYKEDGILEFVARNQLIAGLWPNGKPSREIEIRKETDSLAAGRAFVMPEAGAFNFEGENMASVQQMAHYAVISLDSIQRVLDEKLSKEQRQQELISYEERLIALNSDLEQIIDSIKNDSSSKVNIVALRQIKTKADKQLSAYSSAKETADRLNRARKLVLCHTQLNTIAEEVVALPGYLSEIQESYQDEVWNPFMANLMKEEVKKRITTAYRKVLVPHFLERIRRDLDCDDARNLLLKMQGSYERILELRDEDTSKLERKLRKEQNPEVVLQLFGLQPFTKEN